MKKQVGMNLLYLILKGSVKNKFQVFLPQMGDVFYFYSSKIQKKPNNETEERK